MPGVNDGLSYSVGEPWSGRTRFNGTLGELRFRLFAAGTRPAAMVLEWLSDFENLPDQSKDVTSPIDAPATQTWLGAGFPGWVASPPPRPYYTSPMPLRLELPIGGGPCPLPELQPWWSQVVLGDAPVEPPLAVHAGQHARIGPWGMLGWESGSVPYSQSEHAQFDVYGSYLNVWGRATQTTTRISGPGFVGSLVPGYAEVREFASSVSKQSDDLGFGCRVDFAFVSAVTLHLEWNLHAPLLSAPLKEWVKRRGYGELHEASIGIELTDGWRPWRIQLMQAAGGSKSEEVDQRTIAFAQWLVQVVASHRRAQPYLGVGSIAAVEELAANPPQLTLVPDAKLRKASFRCPIPGSRPISWCSVD